MQSDLIAIQSFQAGVQKELHFTELVKKHQQKLYYQIKRMVIEHADADDIAQIVWIKVWEKLDGFKMESEFSTWLFRIGYNETINFLTKKKKQAIVHPMDETEQSSHEASETTGPASSQIQIKLDQAILQLPEKQRFVFMLRYFEEMPYEKIAQITETTIGGAKANYHQAIKKMQDLLQSD
jgi:RNA polymerase sigma-70 factor (ECF subfamily)